VSPPFRCVLRVLRGFNILLKEIPASVKIRLIRVIRVPHSPSNSKLKTQDSRLLSGQQPEPYKAFKTYKKANKEDYHRSERNGRRGQIQFAFSPLKSLSCMLSCMPSMPCMVQYYARASSKSSLPFRLHAAPSAFAAVSTFSSKNMLLNPRIRENPSHPCPRLARCALRVLRGSYLAL
jgi:hypothetical protein